MKIYYLKFPNKEITRLLGFVYGREIYNTQIANKINLQENVIIIFPNHIDSVGVSFTQGFFSNLIETIGCEKIKELIKINAKNKNIVTKIWNDLY